MEVRTIVQLTDREEAFVAALARGIKPTRAAIVAGWAGPSARALLKKQHIQAAIRAITANMLAVCRRIDNAA